MNISSVQTLAIPDISGDTSPPNVVQAKIAVAAIAKVLHVQKDMGAALVALLDPNVGRRVNASA